MLAGDDTIIKMNRTSEHALITCAPSPADLDSAACNKVRDRGWCFADLRTAESEFPSRRRNIRSMCTIESKE